MERQLATIQKITSLSPIDGADKIEVATILGWKVVVKKDDFKVNDYVVFCEIDSILPDNNPEFYFLKDRGYRIKTIKLRKQISQGICFSLNVLYSNPEFEGPVTEGQDVTALLGVTKYDPIANLPPQLRGQVKGNFSKWVPKTDETRIQSVLSVLEELKGKPYYFSLKMDGTSFTFVKKDGETEVCSRNLSLKETEENLYWKIARQYDLINKVPDNFALQGEIVGPGIQGNRLGLKDYELFVFNVYNINECRYLNFNEYIDFVNYLGIKYAPTLELGDSFNFNLDQLLEIAKGKYDSGHPREGIVVRPLTEMYSERLKGRLSFKVINNDYLLKVGE